MSDRTLDKEKDRKAFEEWYENDLLPLESNWFQRDADGDYVLSLTDFAWRGWQAAPKGENGNDPPKDNCIGDITWPTPKARAVQKTEAVSAKQECVDCRAFETNIRDWIKQLGGNVDAVYISDELDELIAARALPAPNGEHAQVELEMLEEAVRLLLKHARYRAQQGTIKAEGLTRGPKE